MDPRRLPRILFCSVTQEPGHGGIARVSATLWEVMQQQFPGSCRCLIAAPSGEDSPGTIDRIRFSSAAIWRQALRECDAVLFDHLGLARVQTLLPRTLRRPYGVFLHSLEAWRPLRGSLLKALTRANLRIANSRYTAARTAELNPGVGTIEVCHLTLGSASGGAENDAASATILNQVRPNSVLIVGRMMYGERYKGHDQLIRSWPLVTQRIPDAQLVIVGRGDDESRLKTLAETTGAGENILFTGRVSDGVLTQLYRRASVFAMPSRAEGFGIVYLEAMRQRLPCIGSIHDAAGEIIVDGETGFLVDQDDSNTLACKIVRLLGDAELRHRFGATGFERLEREFSRERFATRLTALLRQLAGVT